MTLNPRGDFHGETLTAREVAGFVFREMVHPPGASIPQHCHQRAHVAFVLKGALTERCERTSLECRPLSVSFLAPGVTHSDTVQSPVRCLLVDIAPERFERLREALPLADPIFLNTNRGGGAAWLMMRLYDAARHTDAASSLVVEGLTLELMAELSRQGTTPLQSNPSRSTQARSPPGWLTRAKELLQSQFPEALTHDQLAQAVGVHPVYLAHEFRRYYQCTIGQYVRRLRIEHASRQLASSAASLAEIALAAGFCDQSHFSRVFKRLTGMTPAHFRGNLAPPS
jgi:AraC family transcriptional regulator